MPNTQSLCALLLDDDPFISAIMGDMLKGLEIEKIILESDPYHALTMIQEHAPHVLICDLAIPEMDGIEFLKCLAQRRFDGGIIVVSGMNGAILKAATNLAEAHGLCVLGTYKKPVSLRDLKTSLDKLTLC